MHVVFSIRRPPLSAPRRATSTRGVGRGLGFWRLRDARTVDVEGEERRTPLRRRVMFSGAFFRAGPWEWYLPSVITVWHCDPQKDGSDSSCRNAARARRQAAIKQHRFLAAAWWDWWWRHYDAFHLHHWSIQWDELQKIHRWLLTRCEVCGGRFSYGYSPVASGGMSHSSWRGWRKGEEGLAHGGPNNDRDCASIASLRAQKASLGRWVKSYGHDEAAMAMQREREPYYGCYPWWREAILGESPETASMLAAAHVQRSVHPCDGCGGAGFTVEGSACERCEGTGHERVERPVPAEAV